MGLPAQSVAGQKMRCMLVAAHVRAHRAAAVHDDGGTPGGPRRLGPAGPAGVCSQRCRACRTRNNRLRFPLRFVISPRRLRRREEAE
jgi:hypothetical protein